ncbi:MAG: hypothetical protein ACO3RX_08730, partial [Chthoniobacterales bacterium]
MPPEQKGEALKIIGLFVGAAIAMAASASHATVVFSDNFDDGDVSDWAKSDNGGITSYINTQAALAPGTGLSMIVGFDAPTGGSDRIV